MITRTLFTVAVLAAAVAACGSEASPLAAPAATQTPATIPPVTAAPTTVAATTTIAATTTTPATTTTVAFSRESRLAVVRCNEAVGVVAFEVRAGFDQQMLTDAVALCDEAHTQLDTDSFAIGSPSREMRLQVANLNVALTGANFAVAIDKFDDAAQQELGAAVTEFGRQVSLLMN